MFEVDVVEAEAWICAGAPFFSCANAEARAARGPRRKGMRP